MPCARLPTSVLAGSSPLRPARLARSADRVRRPWYQALSRSSRRPIGCGIHAKSSIDCDARAVGPGAEGQPDAAAHRESHRAAGPPQEAGENFTRDTTNTATVDCAGSATDEAASHPGGPATGGRSGNGVRRRHDQRARTPCRAASARRAHRRRVLDREGQDSWQRPGAPTVKRRSRPVPGDRGERRCGPQPDRVGCARSRYARRERDGRLTEQV
jgi:hypothetical protein